MNDELVERVARAIAASKGKDDNKYWRFWTDDARVAIRVVVEECARVAGQGLRPAFVAAAIRALAGNEITNGESK